MSQLPAESRSGKLLRKTASVTATATRAAPEVVFVQPGFAHYRNRFFQSLAEGERMLVLYACADNEYPGAVVPGAFPHAFIESTTGSVFLDTFISLHRLSPDQVVSSVSNAPHSLAARLWCCMMRRPITIWIEEWGTPQRTGTGLARYMGRKLKRLLGNAVLRTAQIVIASGSAARAFAIKAGCSASSVLQTIQCSDDLAPGFTNGATHASSGIPRLLFMSRLIPSKGLDILLRAVAILDARNISIELVIGGDGPCREEWEALARKLALRNVAFLGAIQPSEVADLFREASIFVLPSIVRDNTGEPWGLVINEATSMGLPIVVSRTVGAGYDLVEEGKNGYVVPENDPGALAEAIARLLQDDRKAMGLASRRIFEQKNRLEHMVETFKGAINRNRSGSRRS